MGITKSHSLGIAYTEYSPYLCTQRFLPCYSISLVIYELGPVAMTGPFFNYTNSFKNTSQDVIR